MNILETISNDYVQNIALDGREYHSAQSNPEFTPNIKVHYEWNVNKFQPDRTDPGIYEVEEQEGSRRPTDTFDLSRTQRELQAHLREIVENISRLTQESNEENKRRLDKLEKDLINLVKVIDQEREDTLTKTNASYKLLEEAKSFVKNEENKLLEETNGLKEQIMVLEDKIKRYDEELVEEAKKNRDLRKNMGDFSSNQSETDQAKNRRKMLKSEIDSLVNQILGESLENMREAKAAGKAQGVAYSKSKTVIFEDVIKEDEKIRDRKLEIEDQNSIFRNNTAVLASKEFDLKLLDQEKNKVEKSIQKLGERQKDQEFTLQEVKTQRESIQSDTKILEDEIRKYESLLDVLNRESGDANKKKRKTQTGVKKGKSPVTIAFEIGKASGDRERSSKNLDNVEEKWQKKLIKVAHEAEKLVSPSEIESEQRTEIERLLKEIQASTMRSVNMNAKLDDLKSSIKQEETLGITKLTEQAYEEQAMKASQFAENERLIEEELEESSHSLNLKTRQIKKEESHIKDLHAKLESLEQDKRDIDEEIEDLTAKVSDPTPRSRMSPKRAALDKKQIAYDEAMEEYRTQQVNIDNEVIQFKKVLSEKETEIKRLKNSISEKEDEIYLMREKIKIKNKIVKERQAIMDIYEPAENDWVDQKIADYCNQDKATVPVKRISQNQYMFGTIRMVTRENTKKEGHFIAKFTKQKKDVEDTDLFTKWEESELKKLEDIEDDQELVVDEESTMNKRQADESRLSPGKFNSPGASAEKKKSGFNRA